MKKSFEVRKNSHARERVVGGAMSSGNSQGIWLVIGYESRGHGGGLGRGTVEECVADYRTQSTRIRIQEENDDLGDFHFSWSLVTAYESCCSLLQAFSPARKVDLLFKSSLTGRTLFLFCTIDISLCLSCL